MSIRPNAMSMISERQAVRIETMRLLQISSALLASAAAASSADHDNAADYVIIGGGVAGLVLAERLSADLKTTVELFEAGPDPTGDPSVFTPFLAGTLQGSKYSWNFTSQPDPNLNGVAPALAQGHGFGGGSEINVMAYCRGASSVFDEWAKISGIDSLEWKTLLEDFEQTTHLIVPSPLPYDVSINSSVFDHGPLEVSYERKEVNVEPYFSNAFKHDPKHPAKLEDLTAGVTGIGLVSGGPHAIILKNGTRDYALPAYGYAAGVRPNVQLHHGTWAKKINFKGKKAVSVTYVDGSDESEHTVYGKEIIISAGAINTPKLLMLSGIGPEDHLEDMKIPVISDNDAVGSSLYDHHSAVVMVEGPKDVFTANSLGNPALVAKAEAEYKANGTGPLSTPGSSTFVTERIPDDVLKSFGVDVSFHLALPKDRPHVGYQYASAPFMPNPNNLNAWSGFVALLQPEASGHIRLKSTDYRVDPIINSNYWGSEGDFAVEMYAYKRLISIMRSKTLEPVVVSEIFPGRNVTSDADIRAAMQQSARTFHHPAGAVSVGKALDASFRLKGLQGIRVVDSSAVPVLPTCHLQASVYALAHHAAKMILGEDC